MGRRRQWMDGGDRWRETATSILILCIGASCPELGMYNSSYTSLEDVSMKWLNTCAPLTPDSNRPKGGSLRRLKLSIVSLVTLLNTAPALAIVPMPSHLPSQSEPVRIAGFLDRLNEVIDTVGDGFEQVERERRRQEEREARAQAEQERLEQAAARQRRQEELDAARRAATEQQRLEAARRQQYFESLSPEQQAAYVAEQRARQEEADQAAMLFMLELFGAGAGSNSSGGNGSAAEPAYDPTLRYENQPYQPAPQTEPQPTNNSGFYGDCHGGPAYGCNQ